MDIEGLELSHALAALGGPSVTGAAIITFWGKIKALLTKGFISSEDMLIALEEQEDKTTKLIKEYYEKSQSYSQVIDGKEQKLSDRVSKIEGGLEVIQRLNQ